MSSQVKTSGQCHLREKKHQYLGTFQLFRCQQAQSLIVDHAVVICTEIFKPVSTEDSLNTPVDAPLSCFHKRNHKSNSKEKASSRFLHASYTFCMTKKDLLIGGWVGVGQLFISCSSTNGAV
jgi:hypothetical protein